MQNFDIVEKKRDDDQIVSMAVSGYVGEGSEKHFCVVFVCVNYSPGAIAPVGQASAQVPQSMQVSGSIE